MSRLNDLIRQLREKEPALADDIAREVGALTDRRAFGLNFERHTPEAVELPGRRVRRGDKVRVLPHRGTARTKSDDRLWSVEAIVKLGTSRTAAIRVLDGDAQQTVNVDDLVVVAEFRDPIYPGLVSTGRIERGDNRPFHTVINAENFHALQTLLFTHRGSVDCVYIDPPYNTGKPDWKYNNRFIESDDLYRHSKWLAFMERRLHLAAQLLNPEGSVLIVSIDEKEYLRLGVLLEQIFPSERIQMISTVINRKGVARGHELARVNEFLFAVFVGNAGARQVRSETLGLSVGIKSERLPDIWNPVMRRGTDSRRVDREGCFYPVYIDEGRKTIHSIGAPLGENVLRATAAAPAGTFATWPIRRDGSEGRWQVGPDRMRELLGLGYLKLGNKNKSTGMWTINYLIAKDIQRHNDGELVSSGRDESGAHILSYSDMASRERVPKTIWNIGSHDATEHGSNLLRSFLPGRDFPFPKSLYAVEDALRFLAPDRSDATILDFFAGSGTTAHAVMRLNKEDGGNRRSISITNNEASANEETQLRAANLRPGDPRWEEQGVFEHVTKPRITAAATGQDLEGQALEGQYRFNLETPYSDGFPENVEFMKLTYETPLRVASGRDFSRIAPLLWLRAGAQGRRIDNLACKGGWDVAETYGVIEDFDHVDTFAKELANRPDSTHAFVVTDDDWLFQSVCASLPEHVEPVRLYEAYLRNFEFEAGGAAR